MAPLLDAIVAAVPAPTGARDQPFSLLVTMIAHDNYLGRVATGRVATGSVREGDAVKALPLDESRPPEVHKVRASPRRAACLREACSGATHTCLGMCLLAYARRRCTCASPSSSCDDEAARLAQVTRILKRSGASASAAQPAAATGDIVSIAGLASAAIGDTLCAPDVMERLSPGQIDPPTLSMVFAPNSSPIGRATGNVVTGAKIYERLLAEAATSVSLQVRALHHGRGSASQRQRTQPFVRLGDTVSCHNALLQ